MELKTKMPANLGDIRIRLDQYTGKIVSGWKDRSRYPQNPGIFTQKFSKDRTWFEYRLYKEQDLDAEFGRFEYDDQHPLKIRKGELAAPIVRRKPPQHGIQPANIEIGDAVIAFYQDLSTKISAEGEDLDSYGETAKVSVENVLMIHERILGMSKYVAQAKIMKDPRLSEITDIAELEKRLRNPDREAVVVHTAVDLASQYELSTPQVIAEAFRKIIDLTVAAEVAYLVYLQKSAAPETISKLREMGVSCTGVGWGSGPKTGPKPSGTGWR